MVAKFYFALEKQKPWQNHSTILQALLGILCQRRWTGGENQQTNNRSLRSAVRVTNLFCAWHCVVFHRPPGQRGVKCCLDKWQTLLPWFLAEFTSTQSGPCNGREDKEGVAEGKKQRRVRYLDKQGRGRDREMSNGRDGSYRDNGKIG